MLAIKKVFGFVLVFVMLTLAGCGGSGGAGSTSGLPAITAQPMNQTAAIGTSITFSVTATGGGLSYQWLQNGIAVSGATSATLTIDPVSSSSGGSYNVVISNGAGTTTSNTVTLNVSSTGSAPAISLQPVSMNVAVGGSVTFAVGATGTNMKFQWFFDGSAIPGASNPSYGIAPVSIANVGTYYVVVSNSLGSVTSKSATLSIGVTTSAPIITSQPATQAVALGSSVTFSVIASGANLTYQWFFGSNVISGAVNSSYSISSVANANVGSYTVVVSNPAGSVTSNPAVLSLSGGTSGGPVITQQPTDVFVPVGTTGTLTVVATGSGLTYQWFENGTFVGGVLKGGTKIVGATSATLSIPAVTASNIGNYFVVIKGSGGTTTSGGANLNIISANGISAAYEQSGLTKSTTSGFTSGIDDRSAVWVTNSGSLSLTGSTLSTTGNSSNTASSAQFGLNAAVVADGASGISLTGGSVTTTGSSATGLFATGTGSLISMSNGSITTNGASAHGVGATSGGSVTLNGTNVTTKGTNSSPLSADFGIGTVSVTGGTISAASTTSGSGSPGIHTLSTIGVSGSTVSSSGDDGAVVDGNGILNLTSASVTGALTGLVMQNTTGSASSSTFTMSGGSLTAVKGDAIDVTGTTASLTASNAARLAPAAGTIYYLLNVTSSSKATFNANGEVLVGNVLCDSSSTLSLIFTNSTSLKGSIAHASLSLDSSSKWTLTANSALTVCTDAAGISGTSITNIVGNGFSATYDSSLAANVALNGKTYSLVGGGTLAPQ